MGRKKALRINIGGDENPASQVWRVWTQADSVYLGYRMFSHYSHISLHKSGVWKIDANSDRFNLNEEIPLMSGWGLGPSMLFPSLELKKVNFDGEHLKDKRVVILSSAPLHKVRVIQLIFQRDLDSKITLKNVVKSKLCRKYDWHASLRLKTRGALHLVSFIDDMDKKALEYCYSIKNNFDVKFDEEVPDKGVMVYAVSLESPSDKNKPSLVINIPLDSDNWSVS